MEELRRRIIDVINASQLPFEAKFYILKDIFRDCEFEYQKLLKESEVKKSE